jgi:redox-sensitive bicupin YhaK (pirin superfamily)
VLLDGAVRAIDTTGTDVVLPAGGVEWMRAGNGVWHTGGVHARPTRLFQLWVALPPGLENAPSEATYLQPDQVPVVGPARVVLGAYGGKASPIASPPMTYLQVELADGEHWHYELPSGHDVVWVAVADGVLHAPERIAAGTVAVLADAALDVTAAGRTRFVIGSAARHPHELYLGNYSVHTSEAALERGEAEIRRIGRRLRADGTLRHSRAAVDLDLP